jgi:hypothetical protein
MLLALLTAAPAHAQNSRSWVSATGSNANPCTRAAPCLTFQRAHDQTNSGGIVNCVNAGDYGDETGANSLFITKPITIDCTGTSARIGAGAGNVAIRAISSVTLRGLAVQGRGTGATGIFATGPVHIENCRISGFATEGVIIFTSQGVISAFITDTVIEANPGNALDILPSVRAVLNRVRIVNNSRGLTAGTGSGVLHGPVSIQVRDTLVAGHDQAWGINAGTSDPASSISVTVDRSSSLLNGGAGIEAIGGTGFVLLGKSTVISNGVGLVPMAGGSIFTYQNNHRTGNISEGLATGTLTEQ